MITDLLFINLYDLIKTALTSLVVIINIAETMGNTDLIICGDFNTVHDETLDYFN